MADEVTDFNWKGVDANTRLGEGLISIGDVNGDEIDDFASMMRGATARGAWILYGPVKNAAAVDFASVLPSQGYRVRTPSGNPNGINSAGDQNGDGLDDILLSSPGHTVIYGVADPAADLSKCTPTPPPDSETRCIETSNPVNLAGDRLGFAVTDTVTPLSNIFASGDFMGDDGDEIVMSQTLAPSQWRLVVVQTDLGALCDPAPGLCTIDISTLPGADAIKLSPPAGVPIGSPLFGPLTKNVGDQNGDGKDDLGTFLGTDGVVQPTVQVIYGQDWTSDVVIGEGGADAGYAIPAPFDTGFAGVQSAGDVNGDGNQDLAITAFSFLGAGYATMWLCGPDGGDVTLDAPTPECGYKYTTAEVDGLGIGPVDVLTKIGDLNGDGADEVAVGTSATTVDSVTNVGQVRILFGHVEPVTAPIELGLETPISDVLAIIGSEASARFGVSLGSAGDQDRDGLPDLYVGATFSASQRGEVRLINGSSLIGVVSTGFAGNVSKSSAVLGGNARANGRETAAFFEYGLTSEYGSTTAESEIGESSASVFFDEEISGLTPATEYHYRAVIQNDMGVKSYGPDRTFTTSQEERCVLDNKLPGCDGYVYCEANPSATECQPDVKSPGLGSLIANSKAQKVKRGKSTTVTTWITSTGTADATGLKICLKAPSKLVKGAKCQNVGKVKPGVTVSKKFKVTAKKRAKKGKKATLSFTASSNGLSNKTAKVKISIK